MWARSALLCLAMLVSTTAAAGPWQTRTPQGLEVRLLQDSFRARDGYLLERRYPDGLVDTTFGQQGAVMFSLGPDNEGPATLRSDASGRLWVAGASAGRGDTLEAVVLRFLPQGSADVGYGDRGRSAVRPGGRGARALDLLPLPDGSAWVAGLIDDVDGRERAGLWRLQPDGRLDPSFGNAGLWRDPDSRSAEVLGLALAADGQVSLRLQHGGANAESVWKIPATARAASAVAATAAALADRPDRVDSAASAPAAAGAVAVTPTAPPMPGSRENDEGDWPSVVSIGVLAACLVLALWAWLRRR